MTYDDDWRDAQAMLHYGVFVAHAERGHLDDEQFELEAYPRLGPRSYAYLAGAVSADSVLYPDWRAGAELYQGFARGFEGSVGYRRLAFDDPVDLYTASLGKYVGNWLFTGRGYHSDAGNAWQIAARRYYGGDGAYWGLRYGVARDEIRSANDVIALDDPEFIAEALYVVRSRWTVNTRAALRISVATRACSRKSTLAAAGEVFQHRIAQFSGIDRFAQIFVRREIA